MTTYIFPPTGKTLYGLTTGKVYESVSDFSWKANELFFSLYGLALAEPDGVTDVRPVKVGDTISSVEELDALPDGAILRDESGVWLKDRGMFLLTGAMALYTSAADVALDNLLTIVWLPEEGDRA